MRIFSLGGDRHRSDNQESNIRNTSRLRRTRSLRNKFAPHPTCCWGKGKLDLYILTSSQVWLPLYPYKSAVSVAPLKQNCYPVLQTCSLYPYKSAGLAAPLKQKCHLHLRTCFLDPNKSAVFVAPLRQNATRTCADLFLLKQFKNKLIPLRENKSASPRASFVCENRGKTQHEPDLYHKRKQVRKSVVVFRVRKQGENYTFA